MLGVQVFTVSLQNVHDKNFTEKWFKTNGSRQMVRVSEPFVVNHLSWTICREPFVVNHLSLNALSVNVLSWIRFYIALLLTNAFFEVLSSLLQYSLKVIFPTCNLIRFYSLQSILLVICGSYKFHFNFSYRKTERKSGWLDVRNIDKTETDRGTGVEPEASAHSEGPVWGQVDGAWEQDQRDAVGTRSCAGQLRWTYKLFHLIRSFLSASIYFETCLKHNLVDYKFFSCLVDVLQTCFRMWNWDNWVDSCLMWDGLRHFCWRLRQFDRTKTSLGLAGNALKVSNFTLPFVYHSSLLPVISTPPLTLYSFSLSTLYLSHSKSY